MKIYRIKELKNIGTFSDFKNGGSLQFEKLTFIYGYNTFGKTTLTDMFQSLKDNDNTIITSRETIPKKEGSQKIVLSIKEQDGQSEKDLIFQNNNWGQNNIGKNIEVFGTDFIHKNLFTGFSMERENKVNFTQFILGDDGVSLAKDIADKRKELREKNTELKNSIPNFVKDKSKDEIKKFMDFSIYGLDKNEIDIKLSKKKIEKQNEEKRLEEPYKILTLENVEDYIVPDIKISIFLKNINTLLQKDYSDIKNEVLEKINNHILNSFSQVNNAENWIKEGLHNCKDKDNGSCTFCGQSLKNAKDLMNAYDSYFDEEYKKFIFEIEKDLKLSIQNIGNTKFSQKTKFQSILNIALKFKTLIKDKVFQAHLTELEEKINLLNEDELTNKKGLVLQDIQVASQEKNKKPYEKIKEIDFEKFCENLECYKKNLLEIQVIIKIINNKIEEFKNQYKDSKKVAENIEKLKEEIMMLEYKKSRIDNDQNCQNCIALKKVIEDLVQQIDKAETKLQEDQAIYLNNYFDKINELFKKFGSRDFSLERENSGRGDMPVYSVKVKFHGEIISNDELKTIFSESDRRALALAIFWTKIDLKNNAEKGKTIVILDDPITSFDDNRISNSIELFKSSLENLSQIIILTHYSNFVRTFCEKTKENEAKFFRLQKNNKTSFLEKQEEKEFTESQYEKTFSKIYGFINRDHDNCIKTDLRPFLENLYLPALFAKELQNAKIDQKDISSLSLKINVIFEGKEDVKKQFHIFREHLNPEAHIFTSNNTEDVRSFAESMIDYLYSFNFR